MTRLAAIVFVAALARARADTLDFRNGISLTGKFISIDADSVSFMIDGEVKSYGRKQVAKITFGSPSAPPASKVTAGQTIEEVTALVGQPKQIVEVGTKKVYIYPAFKITFVDGKVASVE